MAPSRGRVLFVAYDGLEDHIAQSQILPYVEGLARRGWDFTVISHEKHAAPRQELMERLKSAGVRWRRARYHRGHPLRTVPRHAGADVAHAGLETLAGGRFDIVHARSYLPGLSGLPFARATGARFLFDMRGFWFDEKVDSGLWGKGAGYQAGKALERYLFLHADAIVSLTEVGRHQLSTGFGVDRRLITVIPTCVDIDRFAAPRTDRRPKIPVLGYVGSLGDRYPIDSMAALVERVRRRRPGTRWKVITLGDRGAVESACVRAGFPLESLRVGSAAYTAVPAELAEIDATVSFVKPSFASLGSCPTKFGESLAAGAPVVVNAGVGDCADIVSRERVGAVAELAPDSLDRAAHDLCVQLDDPATPARCLATARAHFSLESALDKYEQIYAALLTTSPRYSNDHAEARNGTLQ